MRIAIYHNLASGGAKRALSEMVRGLSTNHEVDVYSLSCAEHDFCDLRSFGTHHFIFPFEPLPLASRPLGRLNQSVRSLDLLRLCSLQRRIAAHVDAAGYDVALVNHCRYGQAPGILRYLRTPAVYYCHEPPRLIYEPQVPRPYLEFSALQRFGNFFDPLPALYRGLLAHLDRTSTGSASAVLVNSNYSRESLYRVYGIFAQVCYLGVDVEYFRPLDLPKQDLVLSVGALRPHKGFDFVLHSLALIDPAIRPTLVIVSNDANPRESGYLQGLAEDLGVRVDFLGPVQDRELVSLYNQALLTVYAPVMEPFGFVPIESMACGTPVIGVCEGGVRETVQHDKTGLLVERFPERFAQAVEALLVNEATRNRLAARGRFDVMERWRWQRCIDDLEERLASVATSSVGTVGA